MLRFKYFYIFLCLFAWLFSTNAAAKPHYATFVMEYPSRTILSSENPQTLNQPASLTKVMTLYLVFQALEKGTLKLNQPLYVSVHAANRQPSKLGLKPNDSITVEEAICGLVTKSANDAASVLAENMAGSENEFADLMTLQARKLGMMSTTFKNASGIADNHQLTTASDMAMLGASIMHDFPQYYHYFSLREFYFNNHSFKNHNHLLGKYQGCDGIKTGYTTASGFNLLSSAVQDGHRLIGVVLGGSSIKSRDLRMMQILSSGFAKVSKNPPSPMPIQPTVIPSIRPSQSKESLLSYELDPPNTTIEEEY